MANHRASGRAHVRPLAPSGRGTHRDSAAVSASVVKVGVLGALATATIAVPLASATASQQGTGVALPGSLQGVDAASAGRALSGANSGAKPLQSAAIQPVAIPKTTTQAVTLASTPGTDIADMKVDAPASTTAVSSDVNDSSTVSAEGYIEPVNAPITSNYGWRVHPVLKYKKLHDGMDFGAECGTPIKAVKGGTVVKAQYAGNSGNRLEIDHGDGVVTGYFHLSEFDARVGDTVTQGEVIGTVGSTGRSTGCHLHFAKMDRSGTYSNPTTLFE